MEKPAQPKRRIHVRIVKVTEYSIEFISQVLILITFFSFVCLSVESNKAHSIKNMKSANQLNKETTCGVRISHDRWALNVKLAEARWAQQQARERELEEVKDFLQ